MELPMLPLRVPGYLPTLSHTCLYSRLAAIHKSHTIRLRSLILTRAQVRVRFSRPARREPNEGDIPGWNETIPIKGYLTYEYIPADWLAFEFVVRYGFNIVSMWLFFAEDGLYDRLKMRAVWWHPALIVPSLAYLGACRSVVPPAGGKSGEGLVAPPIPTLSRPLPGRGTRGATNGSRV